MAYLTPGGNRFDSFAIRSLDAFGGVERIGARPLEDRQRDRGIVVEIGVRRVVERGELDVGDVLAAAPPRSGVCLTTILPNSAGIGEPAERLHRDLKRARMRHRRLIEHAGGDLDVLPLQRIGDVGCGQAERLQAVRVEPDPHRIIAAAEHGDRADAVDAGERIGDFERGVVGDEQARRAICRANKGARPSSGRARLLSP